MYKSILVPIDLTETELAKPAISAAVIMAQESGGILRLINVLPLTPVMLAEYVPPDFETQQRKSAEDALAIVCKETGLTAGERLGDGAPGRHLPGDPRRGEGDQGRSHHHELAPQA